MKKLFGSKKDKKKKDAPDTKEALQGINSQISLIDEKHKSLMARIANYEQEAKALYRSKNQRAAVLKMKQSKMLQKELNKVEGMQILLMQQKMGLEGATFDSSVFQTLKNGNEAMKQAQAQAGVEKFEDLRDDIEDVMADQSEVQDFFQDFANQDADDIEDELKALIEDEDEAEAQKAKQELDFAGLGDLPAAGDKVVKPLPSVAATAAPAQSDDDMLADLMA